MDCNGLADSDRTVKRNRVSPLKYHGQLLLKQQPLLLLLLLSITVAREVTFYLSGRPYTSQRNATGALYKRSLIYSYYWHSYV